MTEKTKFIRVVDHAGNKVDYLSADFTWAINLHGSLEIYDDDPAVHDPIAHYCAPYSVQPFYK